MLSCLVESTKQYPRQRDISMRPILDAMGDFQIYCADWTPAKMQVLESEEMAPIETHGYRYESKGCDIEEYMWGLTTHE